MEAVKHKSKKKMKTKSRGAVASTSSEENEKQEPEIEDQPGSVEQAGSDSLRTAPHEETHLTDPAPAASAPLPETLAASAQVQNVAERVERLAVASSPMPPMQPPSPPPPISIRPFTEKQLTSLYVNDALRQASAYVEVFLRDEKDLNFNACPLNELLNNYMRARLAMATSEVSLKRLNDTMRERESQLWTLKDEKIENEGVCHDKKKVVSIHRFQVAEFNHAASVASNKLSKEIKEELLERHSLCQYKTSKWKLKIDNYVSEVVHSVPDENYNSLERHKGTIRACISVLFSFQRKVINNEQFVKDSRNWLDVLVTKLLSTEVTFQDHLFLLNHVLRCPGGFGHWAASYVQPRAPVFTTEEDYFTNCSDLNEFIALLSTLLSPVKQREDMLREFCVTPSTPSSTTSGGSDDPWVVLDSDGEDGGDHSRRAPIRENDLVALFNQFSIDCVFRYMLKVEKDAAGYDPTRFTLNSFLKLFAFGTQFIALLKDGLQHFNTPQYRQFAKRLGRLIRHTLQYISDHWESFRRSHEAQREHDQQQHHLDYVDPMISRIEVEYDNFFLRAVQSIFYSSAKCGGLWQYLALVPYGTISEDMLWHIFLVFHFFDGDAIDRLKQGDSKRRVDNIICALNEDANRESFEDTLVGLPDTEVLFLLTSFANMATARRFESSSKFMKQVAQELINVGFINKTTGEYCSRGCRDLLSSLSREHPTVLSHILRIFSLEPRLVHDSVRILSIALEHNYYVLMFFRVQFTFQKSLSSPHGGRRTRISKRWDLGLLRNHRIAITTS